MICTFFGHRNAPKEIEQTLYSIIDNLIKKHNVRSYYVGNQGNFDYIVYRVLVKMAERYDIKYRVVLAYMPINNSFEYIEYFDTIIPDGIEKVPKRYAINYRNKWLIKKSDIVITYVNDTIASNAANFKGIAERQGKTIINICDDLTITVTNCKCFDAK